MFWYKTISALLITGILALNTSCSNKSSSVNAPLPDTAKIHLWKEVYDSLNDKSYNTHNSGFLEQAGPFADSILSNESFLLKDSVLRKIFVSTLFSRAIDLNILENFIQSRELLEKFFIVYKEYKIPRRDFLAYAQVTLGNIYSRYGDYKKALLYLNQSLEYYSANKMIEQTTSGMLNKAIALKELHNYNEAQNILQEILQFPIGSKRKGKSYIELADIYTQQHRIADAGMQLQKAKEFFGITTFQVFDKERADIYSFLNRIEGDWLAADNKPARALMAYRQSLDFAKVASGLSVRSRDIGKTYIAMGKAFEAMQVSDSALYFYNKALYTVINIDTLNRFALPQQKDLYAENTIAEALYARAHCIISRGMEHLSELENAVSCYRLAFATESKLLNAFSSDESRLYMVAETKKQTEKAIQVCYQLYTNNHDIRWANEAFLFAEHNKAFVLQESVRRNIAAGIFLQHDSSYIKMQELQKDLAITEIELGKKQFSTSPDTALLRSLNADKQKTEEAVLTAENNLRIKNPQYSNWMNEERELPAADLINKTVSNNTGMVEYFFGDSSSYVFSGSKKQALRFCKLSEDISNIADNFLQYFSNQNAILNNPVQYAAAAGELYQSVLGPYLPQSCTSVLIIPDGIISYIPFDALLTGNTTSTNIASFPFLIKQQETHYAFSCKTLIAQAQNTGNTTGHTLLAIAPVFANSERTLTPLLHSNEELDAIKTCYPAGKFYSGNAATLQNFEANYSDAAIIHLATHASPGNDSFPARIELYDTAIYLNAIYTKKMNTQLVVLSGCQTGWGKLNKSEGLMSLARGFSYAGTKNVIASLWQTEDNSSAAIFKNFYGNLIDNDFSAALHKAKLAMINSPSVAAASPYYWSGYIYIGSPQKNTITQKNGTLRWIAAISSFLIISMYIIFLRRRRQTLSRQLFQ